MNKPILLHIDKSRFPEFPIEVVVFPNPLGSELSRQEFDDYVAEQRRERDCSRVNFVFHEDEYAVGDDSTKKEGAA